MDVARRRRETESVHRFSVGDKIWHGEDFGQVIDINAVRVRVLCIDQNENDYTQWVDPKRIRLRS